MYTQYMSARSRRPTAQEDGNRDSGRRFSREDFLSFAKKLSERHGNVVADMISEIQKSTSDSHRAVLRLKRVARSVLKQQFVALEQFSGNGNLATGLDKAVWDTTQPSEDLSRRRIDFVFGHFLESGVSGDGGLHVPSVRVEFTHTLPEAVLNEVRLHSLPGTIFRMVAGIRASLGAGLCPCGGHSLDGLAGCVDFQLRRLRRVKDELAIWSSGELPITYLGSILLPESSWVTWLASFGSGKIFNSLLLALVPWFGLYGQLRDWMLRIKRVFGDPSGVWASGLARDIGFAFKPRMTVLGVANWVLYMCEVLGHEDARNIASAVRVRLSALVDRQLFNEHYPVTVPVHYRGYTRRAAFSHKVTSVVTDFDVAFVEGELPAREKEPDFSGSIPVIYCMMGCRYPREFHVNGKRDLPPSELQQVFAELKCDEVDVDHLVDTLPVYLIAPSHEFGVSQHLV